MPRGRKKKVEEVSGSVETSTEVKPVRKVLQKPLDYGDDLPKQLYLEKDFDHRKLSLYEFEIRGTFFVDGKCMNRVLLLKKK